MQDQDQEMREETAEVHEEMREAVREGPQEEEEEAVPEDLLQAGLPHPRLEAHLGAFGGRGAIKVITTLCAPKILWLRAGGCLHVRRAFGSCGCVLGAVFVLDVPSAVCAL